MKFSKNVMSGCHGNHIIEQGKANLAFFVLLQGTSLCYGVIFLPFVMMRIIMVYLLIITVNVISLFLHIYDTESVGNKHYICFELHCEDINWAPDCSL